MFYERKFDELTVKSEYTASRIIVAIIVIIIASGL